METLTHFNGTKLNLKYIGKGFVTSLWSYLYTDENDFLYYELRGSNRTIFNIRNNKLEHAKYNEIENIFMPHNLLLK